MEMDLATWDQTIAVDLTRRLPVLPLGRRRTWSARGWGRIINIASQLGIKGGEALAHYWPPRPGSSA